ncbi:MAG: acetyl/propionyl/methylcrotonyl-CoA carboxylase subunit alpha [Verrucomicrobia bacterium]|nr:acetyl/propionyl/methylcrotonyl-CoA carboxylase subunit alpha [Verrucomicrobiota bacterium]MBV8486281.1 acetyl/propionyl/methylcrotonyl-CoA carboxylase subunit alpha [Verrucomicrobiota bacterium]
MFRKLLIANRGEIACRIAATAARLGIRTVAVYSDVDKNAKHVSFCDEAFGIGGATASESYLAIPSIVKAARESGADAIHPGYGFLAENAEFAEACIAAGLVFIGPPAAAIRTMGDKSTAKSVMTKAGVPVLPGYHGESQEPAFLRSQADAIGYPVMLKPRAGGGGKGMRVVNETRQFDDLLAACRREAKNSFGDDSILIEKYLSRPRHIEVQVFGDTQGNCVYLFERDCSVQRRHQKIIEESPAPGLTESQRRSIGETAVAAARAVSYTGAGTIEFLVDQDVRSYFLEMNTRLQVEHPVTEMVTGQDLVEWQLLVAAGAPLPLAQGQLHFRGHAIEARIYAEKPSAGFLPSIGTLEIFKTPEAIHFALPPSPEMAAIRLDAGVRAGDAITPYYDPLMAKLVVWGKDRTEAVARLRDALDQFVALGIETNLPFLRRLSGLPDFGTANLDTGLIARNEAFLLTSPGVIQFPFVVLATAALLKSEEQNRTIDGHDLYSPWATTSGWRLNAKYTRRLSWSDGNQTVDVELTYPAAAASPARYQLEADGESADFEILENDEANFVVLTGNHRITGRVYRRNDTYDLSADGEHATLSLIDPLAYNLLAEETETQLTAPMPGRIVAVLVQPGQTVAKGTPLIVMEAMKMEHTIVALSDGQVDQVFVNVADQVSEGAQLLHFNPYKPEQ